MLPVFPSQYFQYFANVYLIVALYESSWFMFLLLVTYN